MVEVDAVLLGKFEDLDFKPQYGVNQHLRIKTTKLAMLTLLMN